MSNSVVIMPMDSPQMMILFTALLHVPFECTYLYTHFLIMYPTRSTFFRMSNHKKTKTQDFYNDFTTMISIDRKYFIIFEPSEIRMHITMI